MLRRTLLFGFAALAILAGGQSTQAGMIQQTDMYGPTGTPFSSPLSFNSFNTSLGTLTGITIILTENGTVTSMVTNASASPQNYTNVSSTGTVTVSGPDGSMTMSTLSTTPATGTIAGGTPITFMGQNFIIPNTITVGTVNGSSSTTNNLGSSSFASYEGNGTTTYTVLANGVVTTTGSSPSGSVSFSGSGTLGGSVEIDYFYTPNAVPEPASLILLGLGLGGVLAVRRVRRRAA